MKKIFSKRDLNVPWSHVSKTTTIRTNFIEYNIPFKKSRANNLIQLHAVGFVTFRFDSLGFGVVCVSMKKI